MANVAGNHFPSNFCSCLQCWSSCYFLANMSSRCSSVAIFVLCRHEVLTMFPILQTWTQVWWPPRPTSSHLTRPTPPHPGIQCMRLALGPVTLSLVGTTTNCKSKHRLNGSPRMVTLSFKPLFMFPALETWRKVWRTYAHVPNITLMFVVPGFEMWAWVSWQNMDSL